MSAQLPKHRSSSSLFRVGLLVPVLGVLACNLPIGPAESPTSETQPTEAAAPTLPPEATEIPSPTDTPTPDVTYEGVSFSFDTTLATDVNSETVAAVQGEPDDPPWMAVPEHILFTFNGYILPDRFHQPQIFVYPVADFQAANENAGDVITDLQQFLSDRPDAPDHIPFLPVFNAAQMLRAYIAYIDFQNGSGVRFLTQYSQAATPVNNHELFYSFQGLTSDGSYYVAAIFPVANPILPADNSAIPGGDFEAFAETFQTYINDMEIQLSAQPASNFTPNLELLDALIQSLQVK